MKKTTDRVIRKLLLENISQYYCNDNIVVIEELGVHHGSARVDVAVLNHKLHGYEIKSDKDNLLRLSDQISAYNDVFDTMDIVVGKEHIYDAINMIPDSWGILLAKYLEDKLVIHRIRGNEQNDNQSPIAISMLLWKDEALDILGTMNKHRGLSSKPRENTYQRMATVMPLEDIKEKVINTLKNRQNWRKE